MKKENQGEHFTQIPNRIIEALAKTNFCAYESRYVFFLLRKTLGFHKEYDRIANSQFSKFTGIPRPHICRTERELLSRKIIIRENKRVGLNPNLPEWIKLPKKAITQQGKEIAQEGNEKLPIQVATKETKENKQKKADFSFQEKIDAYKHGERWGEKPYYRGEEMRWSENKWWVIPEDGGSWLEFADDDSKIEWVKKS